MINTRLILCTLAAALAANSAMATEGGGSSYPVGAECSATSWHVRHCVGTALQC